MQLLKYGLKHTINPLQVIKTDIRTTFHFIHRAITKSLRDEKQSGEVKTKISNSAHSYVNCYKPTLHALKNIKFWKDYLLVQFIFVVYLLVSGILEKETIDITVNLLFEHNPSFNITKAEFKKNFNLQHQVYILFFKVHFTTK